MKNSLNKVTVKVWNKPISVKIYKVEDSEETFFLLEDYLHFWIDWSKYWKLEIDFQNKLDDLVYVLHNWPKNIELNILKYQDIMIEDCIGYYSIEGDYYRVLFQDLTFDSIEESKNFVNEKFIICSPSWVPISNIQVSPYLKDKSSGSQSNPHTSIKTVNYEIERIAKEEVSEDLKKTFEEFGEDTILILNKDLKIYEVYIETSSIEVLQKLHLSSSNYIGNIKFGKLKLKNLCSELTNFSFR